MVKKIIYFAVLITLLLTPMAELYAQSNITSEETITFDKDSIPQWAKDIRRFDVVAFGIFPIAVMFTNMLYDNQFGITSNYYSDVLLISAGISLTLATVDMIIVLVKRNKERRNLERVPPGSYEIEVVPYGDSDSIEPEPDEPQLDDTRMNDEPSFEDTHQEDGI